MRESQLGRDGDVIQVCKGIKIRVRGSSSRKGLVKRAHHVGGWGQRSTFRVAPGSQSPMSLPLPKRLHPLDPGLSFSEVFLPCSGSSPQLDLFMGLMPHSYEDLDM